MKKTVNVEVDTRDYPSFEAALKDFRKKVYKTGILQQYNANRRYLKDTKKNKKFNKKKGI